MIIELKEHPGQYRVTSYGKYVPGHYADKRAARYAFQFSHRELVELQNFANCKTKDLQGRVIAFADLQLMRKVGLEKFAEQRPYYQEEAL